MARIVISQHITADGFVSGPHGELDWVDAAAGLQEPMQELVMAEMEHVDAILLGASTYRMFTSYWPHVTARDDVLAEPINRLPKHVVSSTLTEAPWGDHAPAAIETGAIADIADRLRDRYEGDIIVWGSLQLASGLLEAGRVDQLRLRVAPAVLGNGTPFWAAPATMRLLNLVSATPLPTGQVNLVYDVR